MRLAIVTLLAGCSSILGIEDLSGPGGANPDGNNGGLDAVDETPGARRINGTLFAVVGPQGNEPRGGVPLTFVPRVIGEGEVSAITSATGNFTIDYGDDSNVPIEGFLRTNLEPARLMVNYPRPFADPIDFDALLFEDPVVQQLAALAGVNQNPQAEFFVLQVINTAGLPVPGVVLQVDVAVAQTFYARDDGVPDPMFSSTTELGLAYAFNAPNNAVSVVTAIQGGQKIGERNVSPSGQSGTRSFVVVVVP